MTCSNQTNKQHKQEGRQAMKEFFLARIQEANSIDELDYIVEQASKKLASNADYIEIYERAAQKAMTF